MQTTIVTTGRVTADLELQTSKNGSNTVYVQFNFAVNKGFGEQEHANFFQCAAFGATAERLEKGKVKKGSLISITGDLDLVDFTRKDGSKGTAAKITLLDWCYPPANKPKPDTGRAGSGDGTDDFMQTDCDEELPFN